MIPKGYSTFDVVDTVFDGRSPTEDKRSHLQFEEFRVPGDESIAQDSGTKDGDDRRNSRSVGAVLGYEQKIQADTDHTTNDVPEDRVLMDFLNDHDLP